jgi:hypothetical protein
MTTTELGEASRNLWVSPSQAELQHALRNIVAGAGARISSSAMLFPFDTIKVHLQYHHAAPEHSPLRTAMQLVRSYGLLSLYRGYLMRLVYIGPSAAVSFTIYDEVKRRLTHEHAGHPLVPFAVGIVLRMAGTGLRTPFDLVKQQLQLRGGKTVRAVTDNVTAGVPFMLRGYTITVMRDGLFSAAYFTIYEGMKLLERQVLQLKPNQETKLQHHLLAGAVAGAVGSCLTAPLDTVKTRLQTQNLRGDGSRTYSGMLDAISRIAREEGFRAFFRGLEPRLVMISASGALTFALYEQYKKWLGIH